MTQFKEGDIVVCVKTTRADWYTVGKEYKVIPYFGSIAVIDNQGDKNQYGISPETGNHKFVLASEYKKEPTQMNKFKVHDVVRYMGDAGCISLSYDNLYDVTDINPQLGLVEVADDNDGFTWVSGCVLTLVSSPDCDMEQVVAQEETHLPKEFKIRIKDENHSRIVQEWLFERGIKWMADECRPRHLTKKYLYIRNKEILHGSDDDLFEQENCSEVEFDIITTITPRIVSTPVETIEIKGKKYNLEDVLKAIEEGDINEIV